MKYLSKEPMFFGPPRLKAAKPTVPCDHQGRPKVFNRVWRCGECGVKLK